VPGVLVTDGMQRKSLAAVRALGRAGMRVVAASRSGFAASLFSRHAERAHLPPPAAGEKALARRTARLCLQRDLDVILPMEEDTLLALCRHRRLLPPGVRLPFPGTERIEEARDKARVLERALALGLPVPRTVFPGQDVPPDFPLPAVVKPVLGSGAVGLRFASSKEGLSRASEEAAKRFGRFLVQERLPREGEGLGVSVLMGDKGRVHALFTHRRLREYPVSGGASTLRESAREPGAEEASIRLLRSFDWRGPAMVEFKRDARDGSLRLMEVNPRFWGSLALAVEAGVNFPLLLARLARGEDPGPPPGYRLGVRARWLLPGDLLHFLRNPARFRLEPSFFRFLEDDLHYDVLDARDPWPALGTVLSFLPFLLDPDLRRFLRR